ncbi:MAG TPA: ATP-binding protein [Limnobacter sp.]|nr:ATP-binding protein [Limnobacter sp.]
MQMNEYLPHGFCINWDPFLLGLHVVSDVLIAVAYFSIPVSLIWISKRQNLGSLQKFYYLFALFILACGITHVIGVLTLWKPLYLLEGYAKAFTALVSIATAIVLIPKLKTVLALPNLNDLIQMNERLKQEVRERERVEAALLRSVDEAVQARNTQARFLANMSHEIRTPMNGVAGAAELLLHTDLDSTQVDLVKTMQSSSGALLNLLNDILDISSLESGNLEIRPDECKLENIFDDVGQGFILEAERKNIDLICPYTPSVCTLVEIDSMRLRQILFNLVGNAIKFTDHGHVTVAWHVEPFEPGKHAQLNIVVKDTGIGIPQDQLAHIFNRFHQAYGFQNATNRGGTGLGLAIVHELVQLMGGKIDVHSQAGEGSVFNVALPVRCIMQEPMSLLAAGLGDHNVRLKVWMSTAALEEFMSEQLKALGLEYLHWQPSLETSDNSLGLDQPGTHVLVVSRRVLFQHPDQLDRLRCFHDEQGLKVILVDQLTRQVVDYHNQPHWVDYTIQKPLSTSKILQALYAVTGIYQSQHSAPLRRPMPPSQKFKGRVVLAEDSSINQKIVLGLLKRFGIDAVAVSDGQQLLDFLKLNVVDLVFVDGQMPVMDGYSATEKIRGGECGEDIRHVPIVAMTAHAMVGERERCLKLGMNGFLAKPLQVDELLDCLRKHLPSEALP